MMKFSMSSVLRHPSSRTCCGAVSFLGLDSIRLLSVPILTTAHKEHGLLVLNRGFYDLAERQVIADLRRHRATLMKFTE